MSATATPPLTTEERAQVGSALFVAIATRLLGRAITACSPEGDPLDTTAIKYVETATALMEATTNLIG